MYAQAQNVASKIEKTEHRVLAEIAIAEHHVESEDLQTAQKLYQVAKEQASELVETHLVDEAFIYIGLSETEYDLKLDTLLEKSNLNNLAVGDDLHRKNNDIAAPPELSAANQAENDVNSDQIPAIDELIEMTRHNQQLFKAAGSLVGQ